MAQLGVNKWEIKNDAIKDNEVDAWLTGEAREKAEAEREKAIVMGEKIKKLQVAMAILRVLFFLWILNNRYSHVGRVCCGDYNSIEILRK